VSWRLLRRGASSVLAVAAWGSAFTSGAETVFDVPLMRAHGHTTQTGFVRVTSLGTGYITIDAWDDTGYHASTFLQVQSGHTHPFNSADLEQGNPAKGIATGIGSGEGDWYLQLVADFDFVVTSYVRTTDGFVTAMGNTLVPTDGSAYGTVCAFEASFFNPAKNRNQVSSLRVIEYDGGVDTTVRILGIDDDGDVRGPVSFAVPAAGARTVTAQQLENGDPELDGSFGGPGEGKWRLAILTDGAIVVMNLLETPTGHLTNLGPVMTPSSSDEGNLETPAGCSESPTPHVIAGARGNASRRVPGGLR